MTRNTRGISLSEIPGREIAFLLQKVHQFPAKAADTPVKEERSSCYPHKGGQPYRPVRISEIPMPESVDSKPSYSRSVGVFLVFWVIVHKSWKKSLFPVFNAIADPGWFLPNPGKERWIRTLLILHSYPNFRQFFRGLPGLVFLRGLFVISPGDPVRKKDRVHCNWNFSRENIFFLNIA